ETFDGAVDAFHIGPVNEPQTPPETLVECASGISGKPGNSRSFRAAELQGLEIAFVETVAVEHQPEKQVVGSRSYRHRLGQASDCPSHAYMHHVAMLPGRAVQKFQYARLAPGHQRVQQRDGHGCSSKGKP